MKTETENENLIRKFLFGEMTEAKRIEFEDKFLANAELFEEIKAFEDDLIEKYVRGWMNPAERLKFEQNFLTTGKRRERVEFARQLIDKLLGDSAIGKNSEDSVKVSNWEKFVELFSTPKIALTATFAVIIVFFGTWVLFQIAGDEKTEVVQKQNSNIADIPTPTISPISEIPPQNSGSNSENSNNESKSNKLEQLKNSNDSIKSLPKENIKVKPPEPKKTPAENRPPNPILALFPGTLRSDGKSAELDLPKNASGATFRLNLESVDYKIFQADLNDADGNVIFRTNNLKPQKSGVNLFIPAKNLKKGDYLIKLSGKNKAGENDSVADFQFRVN